MYLELARAIASRRSLDPVQFRAGATIVSHSEAITVVFHGSAVTRSVQRQLVASQFRAERENRGTKRG